MQRIAKFYKVSFEQFQADWADTFPDTPAERIREIYEDIRLPRRATSGSAGYDFFTPVAVNLKPGETLKIPTGVRAQMEEGWVLQIFPRSSLGFKFRDVYKRQDIMSADMIEEYHRQRDWHWAVACPVPYDDRRPEQKENEPWQRK